MAVKFDSTDNRYFVMYGDDDPEHDHLEEFRTLIKGWEARMKAAHSTGSGQTATSHDNDRFGVIQMPPENAHEHHHHHEDEDNEEPKERVRDEEMENAFTALMTGFRRNNRVRANQTVTGFASVMHQEMEAEALEQASARFAQLANYMFGVRGRNFNDMASAKAWLDEIAELPALPLEQNEQPQAKSTSAAIFYGSTTGSTELIADKVQQAWQEATEETLPIVNVGDTSELMNLLSYNKILVGIPTWNIGKMQDDWEIVYPHLDKVDLSGKQIAIFGVGDQYGYPENFQDAIGILGRKFKERGAQLVGYTSTDGYEHDHSVGIENGKFMGLAIDDINQPELTDGRIEAWITQIRAEFD
ncbi:MAG: flavodoxin [Chloroflexota bacterium]